MDSKKSYKRTSVAPSNYISKKSKFISSNLFFPNSTQFLETCLSQKLSLPIPLMKYIWENPLSPNTYQKLIQCCKLFFIKNSILVIPNLRYSEDLNGWKYCTAEKCNLVCCFEKSKEIGLDKFIDNIWFTGKFNVRHHNPSNLISYLTPKVYRSSITKLEIYNQTISYKNLQCLASGSEESVLWCSSVKYGNGEEA